MFDVAHKNVLVLGLDHHGAAAAELLLRQNARVVAIDPADHQYSRAAALKLRGVGAEVMLGVTAPPPSEFDLAVLSPALPSRNQLVQAVLRRRIPLIGELELGFRQAQCLSLAIAGTNGKSTTAQLIERILLNNHRKAVVAGYPAQPVCAVAEQARDLDFLVLQTSASQLELTEHFRPAVAVLLNLAPTTSDGYSSAHDRFRAIARLFRNQQAFDWAIARTDALARLRQLDLPVPAKVITFSATDPGADLHLDRGLIISRLGNWPGPLLDMDHCRLRGPHNAENLMAALAVGHALRLPLENMTEPLQTAPAGQHRRELIAEINGVQFINDAKAGNVDALHKGLLAAPPAPGGGASIWLIAGGQDDSADFHSLGPTLSSRVKGAFLIGQAAEKIRAAWSLFTPCTVAPSLVEAVLEAARSADSGDIVLFSPACSNLDQFQNYQDAGESFCAAVKSISRGAPSEHPHIHGKTEAT